MNRNINPEHFDKGEATKGAGSSGFAGYAWIKFSGKRWKQIGAMNIQLYGKMLKILKCERKKGKVY